MSVINEDADYRHFKEMLESIPGGGMCVVNDLDLTVVFINDVTLGMLGYTREEFYAETEGKFVRVILPEDRKSAFAGAHKAISDSAFFYSFRAKKKNGEIVWLRESNKSTVAPDGRELMLCALANISDEARLKEEFQSLERSTHVAAAVYDVDSSEKLHLYYASEGCALLMGCTDSECAALLEHGPLDLVHPDNREETESELHKLMHGEGYNSLSFRLRRKGGDYVWVSGSFALADGDGEKKLYVLFSDISEERQVTDELTFTSQQLQTIVDTAAILNTGEDFAAAMNLSLEKIREYFSAQRAYVFEFDWESNTAVNTFQVCAVGVPEHGAGITKMPLETVRVLLDREIGDSGAILRTAELGENAAPEKAHLEKWGIEKMISAPMRADGRLLGFIGVDNPESNCEDLSFLVILSYFFASELTQYRARVKIHDSELRLRELIRNAPGGLCHFRLTDGKMLPITVSKGLAEMVGLSEKAEMESLKKDGYTNSFANIYEEDKALLIEKRQKLIDGETNVSATYRLYNNQTRSYNWVKIDALSVPRSDGDFDVYASYLNVDREINSHRKAEEFFKKVIDQIKTANRNTLLTNLSKNTIDLRNCALVDEQWGLTDIGSPSGLYEKMRSDMVLAEDAERFENSFSYSALKKSFSEGKTEVSLELRLADGEHWRWWRVSAHLAVNPGSSDLVSIFWAEDIHEEKLRLAIIECLADVDYDYISLISAEKNSYTMFAYSESTKILPAMDSDNYEREALRSIEEYAVPEDREMARRCCTLERVCAALESEPKYSYNVRIRNEQGGIDVKCLKYVWLDRKSGLILSMSTDVTDALAEEQKASEALSALLAAVGQNQMAVFTYDFETRSISFSQPSCDIHGLTERGMLMPEKYVEQGFVHPDDEEKYMELLSRTHAGEPVASAEIRYLTVPGDLDSCRWERTVFSSVIGKDGKPHKAYGSSQDITERKLMELRFEREMERLRRTKTEMDFPAYIIFNATKDVLIEHEPGGFPVQTAISGSSMEESRNILKTVGISEKDRTQFNECFDRELVLSTFRDGGDTIVREYRRQGKEPGTIIWARTTVNITQDPESGDIICFCYTLDVTEERTREAVLDTMLSDEYEFVMYIDLKNDSFKTFANKYGGTLLPSPGGRYSTMIGRFNKDCYVAEDMEKIMNLTAPEGIRRQLRYADSFELLGRVNEEDGSVSIKKLRCGYIDKENEIVYCYRVDVTDLFENEQEQKNVISAALSEAERANSAKSRFLTRMSRDMRTPMYEVLGLTKLTLERKDLTAQARENIEQVAKSASFLSEIIDDVLDLSKIESGEISLHYEPVKMEELFGELLESGQHLAQSEDVSLSADASGAQWREVLMDKLRVWQIFSKLITTAVKLADKGGQVRLQAESEGVRDGEATYKFTILDSDRQQTGGLAALLNTYLECDSEISDDFDVVGMALPLVSSLVEQMGGSIQSELQADGSSEVTVILSFLLADDEKNGQPAENYNALKGKRVLLVEDHPTNVLVATKILKSRGILTETAENGQIAVSMYTAAKSGYYDAILMDVRMPVMNGHEATRRIRASGKPDAETVPIIAMTANAFDDDVRASYNAGMTEHLSKPIEPRKLCDALCRSLDLSKKKKK